MAFNPFTAFQKNKKFWMAAVLLITMVTFIFCAGNAADERLVDMLQALTSFAFVDELARRGRSPDDAAGQVSALVAAAVAGVELPRDAHEERT